MASILYKFRSSTTFEALPLVPGAAGSRLWDVKKAIVTAKDLGRGSMEFDLAVQDATTGEQYTEDTQLIPRGSRLLVQRSAQPKGHGLLARLAREQSGMPASHPPAASTSNTVPAGFYTIDSTRRDAEDEYVSAKASELEALRAATAVAGTTAAAGGGAASSSMGRGRHTAGSGGPPPPPRNHHHSNNSHNPSRFRPNADPELREHDIQPKKRATGIPRTFLGATSGAVDESGSNKIQPNAIGFEALKSRGGGQSENATGTKRDVAYMLQLTATTIPEYLQCAICHGVVKDAMRLPWDDEDRTACDACIRTALSANGFRCPITHHEGVSPDDLQPNKALRKAVDHFIQQMMEKVDAIDQQATVEEEIVTEEAAGSASKAVIMDESAVVLTRRATAAELRQQEDTVADDDFGGDVFAVPVAEPEPEVAPVKTEPTAIVKEEPQPATTPSSVPEPTATASPKSAAPVKLEVKVEEPPTAEPTPPAAATTATTPTKQDTSSSTPNKSVSKTASFESQPATATSSHDRSKRRRGPPVGYTMGPAGGTGMDTTSPSSQQHGGSRYGGGRGGGYTPQGYQQQQQQHGRGGSGYDANNGDPRGTKRPYPAAATADGGEYYPPRRGGGFRGGFRGGRGGGRWGGDESYRGGGFRGGRGGGHRGRY